MFHHDLDTARQKIGIPKVVVFEDGKMCAAGVGHAGEALTDVSPRSEAVFVRPMNKARIAQVAENGASSIGIAVVEDNCLPIRVALGKNALQGAPQKSGAIVGRYSPRQRVLPSSSIKAHAKGG